MLINLGAENIYCIKDNKIIFEIPRMQTEEFLPKKIIELNKNFDLKKEKIFVINGPGSFTNLRIGVLSLNLLNWVNDFKLNFLYTDKFQLFSIVAKEFGFGKIGIFVGQKRNILVKDIETNEENFVELDKLSNDILLDYVQKNDYYPQNLRSNMINFYEEEQKVKVGFDNKKIEIPAKIRKEGKILKAFYYLPAKIS